MSDKISQYTMKIGLALSELFNEESEYFIGADDLQNEDNMTDFFHAMANVAPHILLGELVGDKSDLLQFNHNANRLIVQNLLNTKE